MAGVSMEGIQNLSPELQRAFTTVVQADRKPIQNLEKQKGNVEAKVTLLNDVIGKVEGVKSLMPNLNTPIAIRELAVGSTDEKALVGTADKQIAQPGNYSIEVLQLANSASALSNGFADKDSTQIGTGYLSFNLANGETREVFIDNDNATLDGIASIVNRSGLGIKASVVNDQTDPELPYRLVFTADSVGAANDVQFPEFYFVDGEEEFFIEKENPATNALIRYQGHDIETPSNTVTDLISGVTVNLRGLTDPGKPTTLSISQDLPKTTVKIKDLVDKLNGVFSFIQTQNKMDEKTDTTKTLGGEYSLRLAEQRLRGALTQNRLNDPTTTIRSLSDLGIQFNKQGTLTFDEKKFEATLGSKFDEVVNLLTGDGVTSGVIPALSRTLEGLSSSGGGVLSGQKTTETEKISRIQQDIDKKEKLSEQKQNDLKMKLARTQTAINNLQRQGNAFQGAQMQAGLPTQLLG